MPPIDSMLLLFYVRRKPICIFLSTPVTAFKRTEPSATTGTGCSHSGQ